MILEVADDDSQAYPGSYLNKMYGYPQPPSRVLSARTFDHKRLSKSNSPQSMSPKTKNAEIVAFSSKVNRFGNEKDKLFYVKILPQYMVKG